LQRLKIGVSESRDSDEGEEKWRVLHGVTVDYQKLLITDQKAGSHTKENLDHNANLLRLEEERQYNMMVHGSER
jgi:arabinogalactan endo-1,4-beta-galactosidase